MLQSTVKSYIKNLFENDYYTEYNGTFSESTNRWKKDGVCYHQAVYGTYGYDKSNRNSVAAMFLEPETEKPTDVFLGPYGDFNMSFFAKVNRGDKFFVVDGRNDPATFVKVYVTFADENCYRFSASCNENGEWKVEEFKIV